MKVVNSLPSNLNSQHVRMWGEWEGYQGGTRNWDSSRVPSALTCFLLLIFKKHKKRSCNTVCVSVLGGGMGREVAYAPPCTRAWTVLHIRVFIDHDKDRTSDTVQTSFEFPVTADVNDCRCILQSQPRFGVKYSKMLVRDREGKVAPPTILIVVSVKLHWHSGIFNFILKLRLYTLNTLSLLSVATANSKMVYSFHVNMPLVYLLMGL